MKGSLIVVGFFALGCLLGWSGWLPDVIIENYGICLIPANVSGRAQYR